MRLIYLALFAGTLWAVPPSNSVTITDTSGSTQTARPVTISRVFAEGELAGYAKPRVGGVVPSTWQCDVKTRWADNTVRHALISFTANINANAAITVDFVADANPSSAGNQTATDAAALTQAQMLAFNSSGWGAKMEMTNGSTISADARTMLAAGTWRYWLRGPAVTQVIVEDRTTALSHDIGFDAFKVLHPIFVLTFYPGWGGVKVENILENAYITKREDQTYSLALKVNNPLSAAWYTKSSFTMYAGTRWRKTTWSGATPGVVKWDFNMPYMAYTKAIPNYDPTMVPGASTITSQVNLFNSLGADITQNGIYAKIFSTTGGRPELGLLPAWEAQFITSMDPQMYSIVMGYGEITGWVPMHYRESDAARSAYFGQPLTSVARPTFDGQAIYSGADAAVSVGTLGSTGWIVDQAHQSAFAYLPYVLTGDWYWMEELQFWTGFNSTLNPPGTCSYCRHNDWGFLTQTQQARGNAWALRNYAHTAVMTPDGDPNKTYYQGLVNGYGAVMEGKLNITNGAFYGTAKWTWGHDTVAPDGNGNSQGRLPNPLGFLLYNSGTGCPAPELTSNCVYGSPMFMENYLRASMGWVMHLGFTNLSKVYESTFKEYLNVILDPAINHYEIGGYNTPRTKNPGGAWFQTWSDWYTGLTTSQKTAASWSAIAPSSSDADCNNGYSHIARAAGAMAVDFGVTDGSYTAAAAYDWVVNGSGLSQGCSASNPQWAIIPRTVSAPRSPANISTNGTGGGAFHDTTTWAGGLVPIAGDTVSILDGDTVTCSQAHTIGSSPNDQTTVVFHANSSGKLVSVAGCDLNVRGNSRYTAGTSNDIPWIDIQGGTVTLWDSSQVSGTKPEYTAGPAGGVYAERPIQMSGGTLRSHPSGARGQLALNGATYGGRYKFSNATLIGISKFEMWFGGFGSPGAEWDAQNSTFDNCGGQENPGTAMVDGQTYRHDYNVHKNSTGDHILRIFASSGGTAVREILGNVFDKDMLAIGGGSLGGFRVEGNYFATEWSSGPDVMATLKNNFYVFNTALMTITIPSMEDNYIWGSGTINNPHVVILNYTGGDTTFDRGIYGQFGGVTTDAGDFVGTTQPSSVRQTYLKNTIFLPNALNDQTVVAHTCVGDRGNVRTSLENNTWYGGSSDPGSTYHAGTPFPFVQLGEGGSTCQTGWMPAVRNNLLWGTGKPFRKYNDLWSTQTDICTSCDYNGSYQATLGGTKGYIGTFSSPAGAHDVDGEDPAFLDYKRNVELFDAKYYRPAKGLGAAAAWSSGATYSLGDMVQHAYAGTYWNEPITYRYLGCGSNPEPGPVATQGTWGPCWEFASLYRLREGIRTKEVFTDQLIGVYGDGILTTLQRWVRAGFAPTNPAYENTGNTGYTDIGAVRVAYPAYTTTAPPSVSSKGRRGGSMRGGSFR